MRNISLRSTMIMERYITFYAPPKKTPTKNNNNWVKEALPRKRVSDCVFLQGLFFLHGHYSLQSYGDIFKNCRSLIVLYSTVIEWFQKQNLHCLFTCDFFWYPILKYYPICFVYKFHFLSSESTQIKQSDKKSNHTTTTTK